MYGTGSLERMCMEWDHSSGCVWNGIARADVYGSETLDNLYRDMHGKRTLVWMFTRALEDVYRTLVYMYTKKEHTSWCVGLVTRIRKSMVEELSLVRIGLEQ